MFQVIFLGSIDYLTGFEISFSFFYLIPVTMIAWYSDKFSAVVFAIISSITWQLVNSGAGEQFSNQLIPVWNTLTRLGFFIVVAVLLIKLKKSFEKEGAFARTDYLTGAANSRSFYEIAGIELSRTKRYKRQLTICYFDADNFKQINDTLGHHIGSDLLVKVVQTVKRLLRKTDVIARIGGDEFALLLPETNQEQAKIVIDKIRNELQKEMKQENWNVTFSIGVLTCIQIPESVDELIEIADGLMYEVKKSGKNSVKYKELNAQVVNS